MTPLQSFGLGLALLLGLFLPGLSHGAQSHSLLGACAYGTDVSGLTGYYGPAVERASSTYAGQLSGADSATRARARQAFAAAAAAYVFGLPEVTERTTIKHFPHNQMISVAATANPSVHAVVSPNVDTAYTTSWIDLTDGPMVINVPNMSGHFYVFQLLDAFTNAFSNIGSGSTGTQAAAFVLVPPGYTGVIPAGLTRINAPSNTIWLLGRILVRTPSELPAIKQLQEQTQLTPLSAWEAGARQPSVVVDSYPPTVPKTIPGGAQFIATLNNEMNIDPPPAFDDCALEAMAPAGVQVPHPTPAQTMAADSLDESPALPPPPTVASDPVVNAAISAGVAGARQIIASGESKLNANQRRADNGWEPLGDWVGAYGRRYLGRAIVTDELLAANAPVQTIYPLADTDVKGRALTGAHRYTIRFPRGDLPPNRGFWSLTMYGPDRFLYANPQGRYAIGDRTTGLHFASDGSLTLYVQHGAPADAAQRANWLPAPAGQFHLILRLYVPQPAALNGRWRPPPVVREDERRVPALTRLRVRPRVFRPARRGGVVTRRRGRARVSYRDSQPGVTHFMILAFRRRHGCHRRLRQRCHRKVIVARFRHRDRAGANHLFLTGRADGRRLPPGRYVLRAVPHAPGVARTASFRIRR